VVRETVDGSGFAGWFAGALAVGAGIGALWVWDRRRRERNRRTDAEEERAQALEELAFSKGHGASSSVEGAPRRWSFHFVAKGGLSLIHFIGNRLHRDRDTRPRILLLHTSDSFVVRNDEKFVRGLFDTRAFVVKQFPRRAFAWNLVGLTFWTLRHIWRAQGVFFRFVDYYAVIPAFFTSLLRKKLWIVLGGYDAHHLPRWNYGVYHTRLRAWCARYAVRRATHLLPVHESLWDGWNTYIDPPSRTGVKSLVPGIRARVHVVHNGFDSAFWRPDPTLERSRTVIVVAGIPASLPQDAKARTAHLKGIWLTLDVAHLLPDVQFTLAGLDADILSGGRTCPPNVTFAGYLAPGELRRLYQRAKVYAMPSMTEGMPSSLADAMLCECVPVGSNANGIPLLIGDTGFIVEHPSPQDWAAAIEKALVAQTGPQARKRITAEFSMARRFAALREVLSV